MTTANVPVNPFKVFC